MPECPTYIGCDLTSLSTEDLLKLLVKVDSNGCPAINTIRDIVPPPSSNMLLWLDSSLGVTQSGGVVSAWADQSGNGNNAVQAVAGSRPSIVANQVNGLPVIRFDGSADFLEFPELTTIRTAYFVVKHSTGSQVSPAPLLGHDTLFDFHGGGTDELLSNSNAPLITAGSTYVNGNIVDGIFLGKPTGYSVYSFVLTGNGTAKYVTNDRNAGRIWDGDFAEIILYSGAHSTTDRQIVETYLLNKYLGHGIQKNRVILVGNSMTDTGAYYGRIAKNLSKGSQPFTVINLGVAGQTTEDMITNIAPLLAMRDPTLRKDICIGWETTNDLARNASVTDVYNRIVAWCGLVKSAGFITGVQTCLPRSASFSGGQTEAGFNSARQNDLSLNDLATLNGKIRVNFALFSDFKVDVANEVPGMGEYSNGVPGVGERDATNYGDQIHPTSVGSFHLVDTFVSPEIASA